MKKIVCIALMTLMFILVCTGCANGNEATANAKFSIVTTIFPEYDWVKQLTKGNDDVAITMLLDKGVDLHSFQPTADDIVKVANCDMFIYVGGESDGWVEDALAEATNKDMIVINLLDVLGTSVKEEEVVEGMEAETEEEEEDEEEGPEYDEHVWLSLKNADTLCRYICEELVVMDSSNKTLYEQNLSDYLTDLNLLDKEYEETCLDAKFSTVLFGDRFPFRYLVDDYNIDYYAAFVGCSAESEASFETIMFLANKIDELGLTSILQIESADGKIAKTIKDNTLSKDQTVLTMDSMQAVTAKDVEHGAEYIDIMRNNLEVLKQALN